MARKNGNREGSRPRQRLDGRWEARYWVGGKRRSVYGATRKEAADRLAKAIANGDEPQFESAAASIIVRKFFALYDDAVRDTMKRRSLETYRDITRLHLLPAFGDKKLEDLTREHVQRLYSQKRDAGLSAARVRRIHGVLSSALNHVVRWHLVDHNVCAEVSPPRVPAPVVRPFNAEEARRFLVAAQSDRFHALYVLGLTTGARVGELGGLFWSDLDLDRRVMRIQRALITGRGGQTFESPKTPNSRRNVGLSRRAVDALESHRKRQRAEGFPAEGDSLVFTNTVGGPINPSHLLCRSFKPYEKDMRQHAVDKKLAAKEQRAEPEPPPRPVMRRCIVDDITVEALALRLEENPRGFLCAQDELTGFLRGMDQYKSGGKGNARQSYLKIWSNGAIHIDRKGSEEPVVVPKPYVTLQGGIQPAVLGEIADGRDDGFLDRFIFAYPRPGHGGWSHEEISSGTEAAYESLVGRLWDRGAQAQDPDGNVEPRVLPMDDEAKGLFIAEVDNLAAERWSPGFPAELSGPWSKMGTQLAKLTLILAVTRSADEDLIKEHVSGDDMRSALRLLAYFKATTRKVYGQLFEANTDDVLAHDLATFLADTGYVYKGTISNLMKACVSEAMPESPEAAGKAIRRIAKSTPRLTFESMPIGKERGMRLTLEKTVGTAQPSEDHEPGE